MRLIQVLRATKAKLGEAQHAAVQLAQTAKFVAFGLWVRSISDSKQLEVLAPLLCSVARLALSLCWSCEVADRGCVCARELSSDHGQVEWMSSWTAAAESAEQKIRCTLIALVAPPRAHRLH